jgi:TonB family protein
MAVKIKLHAFHFLFRLFTYLADKSGGWRVFVSPKLLIGSLIVGLGLTACGTKTEIKPTEKRVDSNLSKEGISKTGRIPGNKIISASVKLLKSDTGSSNNKDNIKAKLSKPNTLENIKSTNDSIFTSCYLQISVKDIIGTEKKPIQEDKNKVYYFVQQMPEFPGGNDSLLTFVSKNLKWPNTEADVQGKVICRFIVNTDGTISDIEVIRSIEPHFDAEAIRVIKSFPKFIPGKQNGKPVRTYYVFPIAFKLE